VRDLRPDHISKVLLSAYESQPQDFERLLGLQGVGPKTIRALSLISVLVYGVAPSYLEPARYSFAHGGKTASRTRWTERPMTSPSRYCGKRYPEPSSDLKIRTRR